MMIIAVHVIGDRSADRDLQRPRRHRQEPPPRHRQPDDVGQQHTGFAADHAGVRVEGDEAIEPARVEQDTPVVEAHVAVAATVAMRDAWAVWPRKRHGAIMQTNDRLVPEHGPAIPCSHSLAHQAAVAIRWRTRAARCRSRRPRYWAGRSAQTPAGPRAVPDDTS